MYPLQFRLCQQSSFKWYNVIWSPILEVLIIHHKLRNEKNQNGESIIKLKIQTLSWFEQGFNTRIKSRQLEKPGLQ